ncbi:UDP-glucose 6-dehydrogenase, partial [Klebsiella pneumoniae]|nr:UDP-glucose 6-dehydrogenase [Klebsiella pneumoniae]
GDVATHMNGFKIIVNKSTVPVGTARRVNELMRGKTTHDFAVVSNPEFLKEGSAIDDFLKPDRVVIGTDHDEAWNVMRELYDP